MAYFRSLGSHCECPVIVSVKPICLRLAIYKHGIQYCSPWYREKGKTYLYKCLYCICTQEMTWQSGFDGGYSAGSVEFVF